MPVDAGNECPGVPPPSDPCIPKCGNELKIGQPCTKGGYQCPVGMFCTVDFNPTNLAFCTKPCNTNADCGSGMTCVSEIPFIGPKGCTPSGCAN
jgi:hypothetical protein